MTVSRTPVSLASPSWMLEGHERCAKSAALCHETWQLCERLHTSIRTTQLIVDASRQLYVETQQFLRQLPQIPGWYAPAED